MHAQPAPKASEASSARATQPFFSAQPSSGSAFFAPMVQAKCATCEDEQKLQRVADAQEEPEELQRKAGDVAGDSAPPALVQPKCTECREEEEEQKLRRQPEMRETDEMREPPAVQPKLAITPPDDPQEREADHVADAVMRMPDPNAALGFTGSAAFDGSSLSRKFGDEDEPVQRKCNDCHITPASGEEAQEDREPDLTKDADTGPVSPKSEPGGSMSAPDSLHAALRSSRGNGRPLPRSLQASMEGRFGEDFSGVRIHSDAASEGMAKSIRAQAFTYGSDIFFNPSRYDPGSTAGQTLLAHELTHVIQQKGSHPLQRKIQRAEEFDRVGNWAHEKIQEQLRKLDSSLITEAGIAGATRRGKKINSAGFADLYKSQGNQMSGVQAEIQGAAGDVIDVKYSYKNFLLPGGKRRKNIKSNSAFHIGPTINLKDRTWDFAHNFPTTFEVGELKPLFPTEFTESLAYHGTAPLQVDGYIEGFREFVEQAHKDIGSAVPPTTSGKPIDIPDKNIPDSINYKKFEQEHGRKDANTILKNKFAHLKEETTPRVWIYQFKPGLFVYFLIEHPYVRGDFPKEVEKQLKKLDPLLKELRAKKPKMGTALKREVGVKGGSTGAGTISRKGGRRIQAKDDWDASHTLWEKHRKAWARGEEAGTPKPKKFLKEQAKGVEKKHKVDKELNVTPTKAEKDRAKQVKDIRFWSTARGRIFGALYFRFRKVFDKVEELFEKVKKKFANHRTEAAKLNDKNGVFDGWKKRATKVIIRLAVEIFKDMIGIAFTRFMNCINAIVESITDKYEKAIVEEVEEKVSQELTPLCCGIVAFKEQFDAEVEKHEQVIVEFTGTIEKIKEWYAILRNVEIAVRLGVQILSCGTPPALGCLWGLVAQLGISAGLSLLTRTSYFDDYIGKPAAQALMDAIVGDKLHNLMVDVMEKTPLGPHMAGLGACERSTSGLAGSRQAIGGHLDKLDPNDPLNAKARQEWEAEFKDQILKDLQEVFETGGDTPLTEEDFKKLVEALKQANKSPEELKKMLQAARNTQSGKLGFEKALAQVASGVVPEDKPKERKIDYKKAQRLNTYYQTTIGWDPTFFIKEPGIQADSKEFADAVYDMQEATGGHPDGIAGPGTTTNFYTSNQLPKDKTYAKAVQVAQDEKEAKERKKADAEKAAREKADAAPPLPSSVKVVNASQAVPDGNSYPFPKGVHYFIDNPYSYLEWTDDPRTYRVKSVPQYVTLDVFIGDTHEFRIEQVAVSGMDVGKLLVALGSDFEWMLFLFLKDGVQVTTSTGVFSTKSGNWALR